MARLATKTFTAGGSFTLPAGVTTCKTLLWGGGGAGGASGACTAATTTNPSCGGAGGGGALCVSGELTVPNNPSLTIVVGNGGAGGAGSGAAGTVSSVANGGTVLVQAPGASGGQIGKAGAAVGATSFGGPPVTFAGANPANYVSGTQILNAYFPTPLGPSYGGLTETRGAGTPPPRPGGGAPPLAFGNFIGGQPGTQGTLTTDPGGGGGGGGGGGPGGSGATGGNGGNGTATAGGAGTVGGSAAANTGAGGGGGGAGGQGPTSGGAAANGGSGGSGKVILIWWEGWALRSGSTQSHSRAGSIPRPTRNRLSPASCSISRTESFRRRVS